MTNAFCRGKTLRSIAAPICAAALLVWPMLARASHDVLTYRYNLNRDGANTNEAILSPENVRPSTFGKLFECPVDGFLYAQPLYMADVPIPGKGLHNVVFAATEHNTVYAYDADSASSVPLWVTTFNRPGVTSVPISDYGLSDRPATELGITGTPVIDPDSGTLYVVAKIKDVSSGTKKYSNQLYALDVSTGALKYGSPVLITGTYPGIGSGSNGTGLVRFDQFYDFQRPALLLLDGVVYIGFASVGDQGPYHGWLFGYDSKTLNQVRVFNATPNGYNGGIWMAGNGPAVDSQGYIYLATGNGTFDASSGNYGDSILKLKPSGSGFTVADYFTPSDQGILVGVDGDLGSGGVVLLPDWAGSAAHPHLAALVGKDATFYVVDRDNMGRYNAYNDTQIVQTVPNVGPAVSTPAAFNGRIYHSGLAVPPAAYAFSGAHITPTADSKVPYAFGSPGCVPTVSANGSDSGIVWMIEADSFYYSGPAILRAFDSTNLNIELYNTAMAGSRDQLPVPMKFSVPIVANGKVYMGTGASVAVLGLLNGTAASPPQIAIDQDSNIIVTGVPGGSYVVQYTDDLSAGESGWVTLTTLSLTGKSQTVTDQTADSSTARYYRAAVGSSSRRP